jgi:hypothetical protein
VSIRGRLPDGADAHRSAITRPRPKRASFDGSSAMRRGPDRRLSQTHAAAPRRLPLCSCSAPHAIILKPLHSPTRSIAKPKRFFQTVLREWAYLRASQNSGQQSARDAHLASLQLASATWVGRAGRPCSRQVQRFSRIALRREKTAKNYDSPALGIGGATSIGSAL